MDNMIARMNERITVQKNTVVIDKYRNHKNAWEDYYSCHAYASTYSGDESEAAGTTVEDETITFTVRWCSEVSRMTPTGYRVFFHGAAYDITSIDPMNYQHRTAKIECRREHRQPKLDAGTTQDAGTQEPDTQDMEESETPETEESDSQDTQDTQDTGEPDTQDSQDTQETEESDSQDTQEPDTQSDSDLGGGGTDG